MKQITTVCSALLILISYASPPVSGQYGLTDTITEFALSSSGYITYLKINGKKATQYLFKLDKLASRDTRNITMGMQPKFTINKPNFQCPAKSTFATATIVIVAVYK